MSAIVFGADLWRRPDDYQPPAIEHDDPLVMKIAKAILNGSGDYHGARNESAWDSQMRGAMQDSEYYAEPYRRTIAHHIEMAVAVRDALRVEEQP